ncbi:MAG: transposase [Candidatus Brocadiaceae bacterium]|nr:transposase [Candidatus Brocadiaceae bacterium]
MKIQRKRNRLQHFDYSGSYAYSITICCYDKNSYFTNKNIVLNVLDLLNSISSEMNFFTLAYCFMPNHLHILTSGGEGANLIKFIKKFKQVSGYNFKKITGNKLWQKSYHDHVIRKEEDLNSIAEYIFNNPVRKGLVEDYDDYPFLGPKD